MKRTIKLLALAASLAVFAAPALAQSKECNDENKGAWYKTFYDNFRGTAEQQKTAVEAAKTYLAACPADPNDKQADYMRKFVDKYEAMVNKASAGKQFEAAVASKNYAEQIKLGKQILASDPNNSAVAIVMGVAGISDPNLLGDSAEAAQKAIALIEAGKPYAPIASKDQALAYLNYVIAKNTAKTDPTAAIPYFLKTARFESDLKKNPLLYNELAAAYGGGPVAKLAEDYKPFVGKPETNESKLVLANLNQAIDRQIDAFARAAALSTNPADKKAVMDVLTEIYKSRNQGEAGLNELVANILSKPIPDAPTPITSLPSQTTSTTATNNSGTSGAGNGATSNGKPPASNNTPTNTSNTGSAKPSPSPTPMAKKPPLRFRRN